MIYLDKYTNPLLLLNTVSFLNLSTFLPLWNPNFSNTSNGASTDKTLTWSSSNINLVDVDQNGNVTIKSNQNGSAVITVKSTIEISSHSVYALNSLYQF